MIQSTSVFLKVYFRSVDCSRELTQANSEVNEWYLRSKHIWLTSIWLVFWFPLSDLTHQVVIKSNKLLINQHEMAMVDRWLSDEYTQWRQYCERINFSPFTYKNIAHRSLTNTHPVIHSFIYWVAVIVRYIFCFSSPTVLWLSCGKVPFLSRCIWFIQPNFQSEMWWSLSANRDEDIRRVSASGRQQFRDEMERE